jgi:hypothetical protein
MKCVERTLSLAALLLVLATPAASQITTTPSSLRTARAVCAAVPSGPLSMPPGAVCGCRAPSSDTPPACARPQDELTRLVDHDTTAHLVTYLQLLVNRVKAPDIVAGSYFRLVWPAVGAEGKLVARQLVFQDGAHEPVQATLPGIVASGTTAPTKRKYYDVLVTFDAKAATPDAELPGLESFYSSSEKENPVLAQVPAFVGKLGILEALAAGGGVTFSSRSVGPASVPPRAPGAPPPPPPPPVRLAPMPQAVLKVYAPSLPHKRAEIAVRDWIVTPSSAQRISSGAVQLGNELKQSSRRVSECGVNLAAEYATALSTVPAGCASVALFSAQAGVCRNELNDALDTAYEKVVGDVAACPKDTLSVGSDPVASVDSAFRDFVTGLGATVAKGESSLKNVPREKISFGLMTAVRFGDARYGAVRSKVGDDGNVREDPLPRLVNAVVLNWHPSGYDSSQVITYKDPGSFKIVVGTTLSPDFGILGGVGYSPLKGLSFNVAYATLLINAPRDRVNLGEAVPAEFKEDPFRTSHVRTFVWGLSYSFQ